MLNFGNKEFRNLQEQVLKNAQDIETLKGREDLQIVIVNELPAVGDPNYIYLVAKNDGESPDVYDEYIWLENEQRYEKIGGVSIDLTNYMTLDTDQTVTGKKTFTDEIIIIRGSHGLKLGIDQYNSKKFYVSSDGGTTWTSSFDFGYYSINTYSIMPLVNNDYNIGSSSLRYKDLNLSGRFDFGTKVANRTNTVYMDLDNYDGLRFYVNANNVLTIYDNSIYINCNFIPNVTNSFDLGSNTRYFNNLYLVGYISDGTNTVSVANIASKVTSTFISGSFDADGQSIIDISGGTPEGLFIFTYGNCQCFLRLTATMVQNADLTPIRVSCPMIFNNDAVFGWLEISRSGTTLTIRIINDAHDHVDSGYAWTLTKTNLL